MTKKDEGIREFLKNDTDHVFRTTLGLGEDEDYAMDWEDELDEGEENKLSEDQLLKMRD